jgi:hypothetical protein
VGTRARFQSIAITARHTTKVGNTRSRWPNPWEGAVEGGIRDWGEVVIELRPSLVTASTNLAICWKPRKYPVLPSLLRQRVKMHLVMRTISREVVQGTISTLGLTPQRPHAELLERSEPR